MDTTDRVVGPSSACAVALERNPDVARAITDEGHDVLGHDQGGINLRCPDIEIPYSLHPNPMKGTKTVGDGSGGTYTITWDLDLKTACDE